MPITEKQRKRRRKSIGSSDAAAIRGLDPWRNAADVFVEKTQSVDDLNINAAMDAGNRLESAVLQWAKEQLHMAFVPNRFRRHPVARCMHANIDGLTAAGDAAVEVKTVGILGRGATDGWGATETDDIPANVLLQCHHIMAVVPTIQVCWVPVLLGGIGFRLYKVDRDEAFAEWLVRDTSEWWSRHIVAGQAPADLNPSLETLKRMHREPGKEIELPDSVLQQVQDYELSQQVAKHFSEIGDELKASLIASLGDAEIGLLPNGRKVKYTMHDRVGYTVKPTTYQRFSITKDRIDDRTDEIANETRLLDFIRTWRHSNQIA